MADEVRLTVRLFGGLRDHAPGRDTVAVSVRRGANGAEVRAALGEVLGARALVASSALANDREVLSDDAVFERDADLAILPPVSGG